MPSFDVVSELNQHELENALQQAQKEVGTRFDFRGTDASIERTEEGIVVRANSEGRLEAAYNVFVEKCIKRKIDTRALQPQKPEIGAKGHFRQLVKLEQGISKEKAKELIEFIKASKVKVQAAIQGEQLRITGKKKDDLQQMIQALRGNDFGLSLQFTNFRD